MLRIAIPAVLLFLPVSAHGADWTERDYQRALCAGMEIEITLPDGGGRADCSDGTHIIEVDWADKFKEGVGQVLTYSVKSELVPGLILVCRRSEATCLQHGLIAEEVLAARGIEAVIWRCGREARSLSDCLMVTIAAKP